MSCKGCPSVKALLAQATLLHPRRSTASDGICASQTHHTQNPSSDHEAGPDGLAHACDLTHDPKNGCDAHAMADYVRLEVLAGREKRVKYIISNRRIFNPHIGDNSWRPYHGTNPHDHHAHFSVLNDASENDTSWWFPSTGLPNPGSGSSPAPTEEEDMIYQVRPHDGGVVIPVPSGAKTLFVALDARDPVGFRIVSIANKQIFKTEDPWLAQPWDVSEYGIIAGTELIRLILNGDGGVAAAWVK